MRCVAIGLSCLLALSSLACGSSSAPNSPDGGSPGDGGGPGKDSQTPPGKDGSAPPPTDGGKSDGSVGPPVLGKTSIAWAFIYLDDTLNTIKPNASSFTHVAPLIYDVNYAYASGVAEFWNTPTDTFQNGLTSTTITAAIHAMGLKSLPVILGGAGNSGTDDGIHTLITDSTAQASFISSMVTEAMTKKYDGYNIDWEMSQGSTTYAMYGTQLISFLGAFKSALNAQGMILTYDVVDFNVVQSNCSGGAGPVDLTKLGAVVDLAIVEDYNANFGTASSMCPTGLADPLSCTQTFMDDLNFMCAYLPASVISIGMSACSSACGGSNPIASQAIAAIEGYGIKSVALFPEGNSEGPSGAYAIYDSNGITPSGSTWFSLFSGFLAH
jgi:hypothetical protein